MSNYSKTTSPSTYQQSNISYGIYGASNINPYASYFGPQTTSTSTSSVSSPPSTVMAGTGTGASTTSTGFMSPINGANNFSSNFIASPTISNMTNPYSSSSFHSQSTSPFGASFHGHHGLGHSQGYSANISGIGSPGAQPPHTRIIGGINHSAVGAITTTKSPTRYQSSSSNFGGHFPTPGSSEDGASEPMHLSPIHSSPISGHSSNTVMLPSFFLGLDNPNISYKYQSGICPSSPNMSRLGGSLFPDATKKKVTFEPEIDDKSGGDAATDEEQQTKMNIKIKGPPIYGFGDSDGCTIREFLASPLITEVSASAGNNKPEEKEGCVPQTQSQSPEYVAGGIIFQQPNYTPPSSSSPSAKCWITIFGFPAGATSFIVSNFATLGKIMEIKCTPGSNWIHIRYTNLIEARRALTKNGKVLGGSIMVGVITSDMNVIQDAENANLSPNFASPYKSPNTSSVLKEKNFNSASGLGSGSIKSRIRPLGGTNDYGVSPLSGRNSAISPRCLSSMPCIAREYLEVERNPDSNRSIPTPSTGIISKAMEWFGW